MWESFNGSINLGQTIPINIIINNDVKPGTYTSPSVNMMDSNGQFERLDTTLTVRVLSSQLDQDNDGFINGLEYKIGTDMVASCSNNSAHAAWPPDIDNNRFVNLTDIFAVARKIGSGESRYDLNGDGSVTAADIYVVSGRYGQSCTN